MFIDHFVWVTSNLLEEMERFTRILGVRAVYGGYHPGQGTHNALIDLGGQCYLELLAPDPHQASAKIWMIANKPLDSGLIHWAWRTDNLVRQIQLCKDAGWVPGPIQEGQRQHLQWRLTDPDAPGADLQPFLIEWFSGRHPTDSLSDLGHLGSIILKHPTPESLTYGEFIPKWPECRIKKGSHCLIINLETPKGNFVLRSGSDRIIAV